MENKAELKDRLKYAMEIREKKASDLARDLKIPKSALSQYLSGYRSIKDTKRLYIIAKYLDVSEAWLMGFAVPMERPLEQKQNDELVDLINRLKNDKEFRCLVSKLDKLNSSQIEGLMKLMGLPQDQ